jgi:hypothetical protein
MSVLSFLSLRRNSRKPGRRIPGVHKVRDIALQFRMGAGFAGDVNRAHPANIEPCLPDPTSPPTAYGQAVIGVTASQGVRPLAVGDAGTSIYGVVVRPYPVQQTTGGMAASLGGGIAGQAATVDVIKNGYVLVHVVGSPTKFGPVNIWTAAPSGAHVTGGFEAAATAGSTAVLAGAIFNGSPDASGIAELILNF